ncbi:MAG: hypothetical protein LC715_05600 [Gammaproteobacteria bacterium]|nr:hypothetical protein [Gammaproteobacteria bacterium]
MKICHSFLSTVMFALVLLVGVAVPTATASGPGVDNTCAVTETSACGKCGDGHCTPQCGETAQSCPKDCGGVDTIKLACGKCGDGRCTPQCGENAETCPKDCGYSAKSIIAIR